MLLIAFKSPGVCVCCAYACTDVTLRKADENQFTFPLMSVLVPLYYVIFTSQTYLPSIVHLHSNNNINEEGIGEVWVRTLFRFLTSCRM